ncbi:MAG: NapC/NirT family cytochrome c [Armatimonadota bacterium]
MASPFIQWLQALRGVMTGFRSRLRRVIAIGLKLGLALLVLMVVMGAVGLQYSQKPKFCTTCHNMQPYYDSWKTSAHKEVKCIECHYKPGIKNELQKKFEALNQVASYVTNQYGTRPSTQVDDASCLRSGCHDTRLLKGKVDFNGVEFDHAPHLSEFRRVTKLRCASCHQHVMEDQHMTVSESTCFLCHFKDHKGRHSTTADCDKCHKQPLPKTKYDHSAMEARKVNCVECHANIVQGHGEVPEDRCVLCHSEKERLDRFSDTKFMHQNHVTDHKIECRQCHNTIQHKFQRSPETAFTSQAVKDTCSACHDSKHSTVAQFYAGKGGVGVAEQPDPMYGAGVSCDACHKTGHDAGRTAAHQAGSRCVDCHDKGYDALLGQWRREFDAPVRRTHAAIVKAKGLLKGRQSAEIDKALANIKLLMDAGGVHNPQYARQLLSASARQANTALQRAGVAYRVPVAAAAQGGSSCEKCHTAPDETLTVFGGDFKHAPHTEKGRLDCARCHRANNPEDAGHGKLTLTQSDCRSCHAGRKSSPHPANWQQGHGASAKKGDRTCASCHAKNECNTCHGGVAMPHAASWSKAHGASAKKNEDSCRRCHQQNECASCHETKRPHADNWIPQHGKQAKAAPGKCATCHQQSDCATCHKDGGIKPSTHGQQWPKDHPKVGEQNKQLCGMCHAQKAKQDVCNTCHGGVAMPHSDDFKMGGHSTSASFDAKSACFTCHKKEETCAQCHE